MRRRSKGDMQLGGPLHWSQPRAWRAAWELLGVRGAVGGLVNRGRFACAADGWCGPGRWSFHWGRFVPRSVLVLPAGRAGPADAPAAALYEPAGWAGGRITLRSGAVFRWQNLNWTRSRWQILGPGDVPVVAFRARFGLLRYGADVGVRSQPAEFDALPLLLLLGWVVGVHRLRAARVAAGG